MKPSVSVIIPTLNEAANIGRLLEQLAAQSVAADEVIVVDGGSDDGTSEIVGRLRHVRLLRSERGVSLQRNAGALAAKGEILFFIDADTRLTADFIGSCLAEFARRRLDAACPHYWPYGSGPLVKLLHASYNATFWTMQKLVPAGGGSCIIMHRALFEATPGFEQGYPFDDMKLLRESRKSGGRFGFIRPVIGVSDRRFRRDGVIRTAALYALLSPLFFFNLHGATKRIHYNFGHYGKK